MLLDRKFALGGLLAAGALALGACGGEERSTEAFCERVDEAEAVGERFADLDPSDLEGTQEAYQEASEEFGRISEVAPEEIRSDVERLDEALEEIADAAGEADSPEQLREELSAVQERFAGVQEANERVTRFEQENCRDGGEDEGQGGGDDEGQGGGDDKGKDGGEDKGGE